MNRATLLLFSIVLLFGLSMGVQCQTPGYQYESSSHAVRDVEAVATKEGAPNPSVYLIAPSTNVSYIAPAAPVFYVSAYASSTTTATIDHVDFLDGNTIIGTVTRPNGDPSGHG